MPDATALIVEDSQTQALIIGKMIEELGWSSYHCLTIREGCEVLAGMSVQAIFLDIFVGQHNGLLHIERFRKLAPSAPLVLMTAGGGHESIDETLKTARKAGADYVLRKPFTAVLLADILQFLTADGAAGTRRKHVLVIDDSQTVRTFIANALRNSGYRISQAASMEEAFDNVDIAHVDLVLCDVFMPGMGGLKGMRTIRQTWPKVRIISMSAGLDQKVSNHEAVDATRRFGVDAQILKPFTGADLTEVIQAVLDAA